jgi:NAD(P)H-dependent FMN reductase
MNIQILFDGASEEEKNLLNYLKTLPLKFEELDLSNKNSALTFSAQKCDALLILISETNKTQLGKVKKMLEYLSFDLKRKPAGIISYGKSNSSKNIDDLKLTLLEMEIFPISEKVRIIKDENNYQENGNVYAFLEQLNWWGKTMRNERVNKKLNVRIKTVPQDPSSLQNNDTLDSFISSSFWKN